MMSSRSLFDETIIECTICTNPYDNVTRIPIVGSCGHTVCKTCVNTLRNTATAYDYGYNNYHYANAKCPTCQAVNAFDRMTQNYGLKSIIDSVKKMKTDYDSLKRNHENKTRADSLALQQLRSENGALRSTKQQKEAENASLKKNLEEKNETIEKFDKEFNELKRDSERQITRMALVLYEKGSEHNEKLRKLTEAYSKAINDSDDKISALKKQVNELKNINLEAGKNVEEAKRQIEILKSRLKEEKESFLAQLSNLKNQLSLKNSLEGENFYDDVNLENFNESKKQLETLKDQEIIENLEKEIQDLKAQIKCQRIEQESEYVRLSDVKHLVEEFTSSSKVKDEPKKEEDSSSCSKDNDEKNNNTNSAVQNQRTSQRRTNNTKKDKEKKAKVNFANSLLPTPTKVFIYPITDDATLKNIKEKFSEFGKVESVFIGKREDGMMAGFAFIRFGRADSAETAIEKMNNKKFLTYIIRVTYDLPEAYSAIKLA